MISEYSCPLCGSDSWETVQKYKYYPDSGTEFSFPYRDKCINLWNRIRSIFYVLMFSAPKPKTVSVRFFTAYEMLRKRVLFDIWFPGEKEIALTSRFCTQCGFMAYSPRPDNNDLEKKYAFLTERATSKDVRNHLAALELDSYSKRNRDEIFRLVTAETGQEHQRVLDFGGGIGWYLMPFFEHGHECLLIDFDTEQLPGIRKIADVIEDIPGGFKCDVVISRATLEHVADPLSIVGALYEILDDGGILYALVPDEINGGINRLGSDPVTHVNFFTSGSFEYLLRTAGYEILNSGIDEMQNIWVVAQKRDRRNDTIPTPGCAQTERLLHPGKINTLKRIIREIKRRF
ncbi:class I SAM-dependent methyltransferase [Candidatus Latescibacterota bacterium]